MQKIDTMSPTFFAGFIGYALSGTGMGFAIAAALSWFLITFLFVIAVAVGRNPASEAAKPDVPDIEFAHGS
jgi:hypothetical protein